MPTALTTVVCHECRHENEPERVYCHGCGARLDRSSVKVMCKEDVEDARKRVKKLFDPRRAQMRALFFKISKLLLGAGAVAALAQLVLPPDVPPPTKSSSLVSQLRFELEATATRHQPPQLRYTDDDVNVFLAYSLKTKQKALDQPLLDFKRAIVGFQEGACTITMERSLFGYSLFTTISVAPSVQAGKITVASRGGRIGRLPIHPQIAQYMGLLFADLWSVLDQEKKLVAKMGAIEFHDHAVVLTAP
jgi:hypothetical protein